MTTGKQSWVRFFGAVALMGATAVIMLARNRIEVVPAYEDLQNFPQINILGDEISNHRNLFRIRWPRFDV